MVTTTLLLNLTVKQNQEDDNLLSRNLLWKATSVNPYGVPNIQRKYMCHVKSIHYLKG